MYYSTMECSIACRLRQTGLSVRRRRMVKVWWRDRAFPVSYKEFIRLRGDHMRRQASLQSFARPRADSVGRTRKSMPLSRWTPASAGVTENPRHSRAGGNPCLYQDRTAPPRGDGEPLVIPAQAGIHAFIKIGPRLRGGDGEPLIIPAQAGIHAFIKIGPRLRGVTENHSSFPRRRESMPLSR